MTMDYGPDWPPAPEPPKPEPRRKPRCLLRSCVVTVVVYALIAVGGLLLLHIRQQHPAPFDPYKPSAAASTPSHQH